MTDFSSIGSYIFSSELKALTIAATADITVKVAIGSTTLINNTYTPTDGTVTVYDLHKLLEMYIDGIMASVTITAGSDTKTTSVIRAVTSVSQSASEFLPAFFLTAVTEKLRDTAPGRRECLSLVVTEDTAIDVTATCEYLATDGSVAENVVNVATGLATATAHTIDVSPNKFASTSLGTLLQYTITAGSRSMTYRLRDLPAADPAVLLRNLFGAWEPFYLTGSHGLEPDYTRSTALMGGALNIYQLEETQRHVCHSGPLRYSEQALGYDLARSRDVYLLEGTEATRAIVISDVDVKTSGDYDETAVFSYTWQYASEVAALLHAPKPANVFDETFDNTYE